MAETKNDANAAFDAFFETYAIKYDKAVGCLTKGPRGAAGVLRLPC
jgi:putative transposase